MMMRVEIDEMARGGAERRARSGSAAARRRTSCSGQPRSSAGGSTRRSRSSRRSWPSIPADAMALLPHRRRLTRASSTGTRPSRRCSDRCGSTRTTAGPTSCWARPIMPKGRSRRGRGHAAARGRATIPTTSPRTTCSARSSSRLGRADEREARNSRSRRSSAGNERSVKCAAPRRSSRAVACWPRSWAWRLAPALGARPTRPPGRSSLVDVAAQAGLTHPRSTAASTKKRFIIETNGAGVALLDSTTTGGSMRSCSTVRGCKDGTRETNRGRPIAGRAHESPLSQQARRHVRRRDAWLGTRRVAWSSSVCVGDYRQRRLARSLRHRATAPTGSTTTVARAASTTCTAARAYPPRARGGDRAARSSTTTATARLDLFVSNYLRFDLATASEPGQGANCLWKGIPVNCGPKGLPTDTNLLYHKSGTARSATCRSASGIATVRNRYSMTATAADFDGDGWTDIYVASTQPRRSSTATTATARSPTSRCESGVAFSENGQRRRRAWASPSATTTTTDGSTC